MSFSTVYPHCRADKPSCVSKHGHPVEPDRVDAARQRGLSLNDARALDSLLSLLADTVRTRVLVALVETDEMCVGDLALALDVSEDSASYALRVLRSAGLVRRRTEGRMRYYRLRDGELRDGLVAAVEQLRLLSRLHLERVPEDDG